VKQRIVVVGGLAAGPSAASKAKRVNPNAEVLLLEQGEYISYGICEIPYFIGGAIQDPSLLVPYSPERLRQVKGVEVKTGHRVDEIQATKKKVIARDLEREKDVEFQYDKLILATGSRVRTLGLEGEDSRNVFHVKSLEDGYGIRRFIEQEKPRRAVVIGGGYVGMEMCEALSSAGLEVTLLHRAELPMSRLEQSARTAVVDALGRNRIRFQPRQKVRSFERDGAGKVTALVTAQGRYPADLVILALGVEPRNDLARTARLSVGKFGGLTANPKQETNVDGIYAAGDCCEVKNIVNNKWMYVPLATYASRQGWVAGENAAGGRATFGGAIRAMGVKIFDIEVAHVGLSSKEAEDSGIIPVIEEISGNSRVSYYPGNSTIGIILVADKTTGRLLGANVYGGDGAVLRANTLAAAIQHKLTLEEVAKLDLIYAPPFAPLWDPILTAARTTAKKIVGKSR